VQFGIGFFYQRNPQFVWLNALAIHNFDVFLSFAAKSVVNHNPNPFEILLKAKDIDSVSREKMECWRIYSCCHSLKIFFFYFSNIVFIG